MTIRVLHVLHQGGGAGSVTSTLHLSAGLQRAGVAVRFACPPDSEVEAEARARGLEVYPLPLRAGQRRANAAALAGLLDRVPVDLVNSQSARDREALTWLALSGRLRVPLVVTRRQMPRTFFLENWLAGRAASRVIAVSRPWPTRFAGKARPRASSSSSRTASSSSGWIPRCREGARTWRQPIGWQRRRRTIGIVARPKDQRSCSTRSNS